jgi:hypothetical protein
VQDVRVDSKRASAGGGQYVPGGGAPTGAVSPGEVERVLDRSDALWCVLAAMRGLGLRRGSVDCGVASNGSSRNRLGADELSMLCDEASAGAADVSVDAAGEVFGEGDVVEVLVDGWTIRQVPSGSKKAKSRIMGRHARHPARRMIRGGSKLVSGR